jgi:hypothetical protein
VSAPVALSALLYRRKGHLPLTAVQDSQRHVCSDCGREIRPTRSHGADLSQPAVRRYCLDCCEVPR